MQVTREELNPCTIKLTVVCDPEQVTEGFNKAFKQIAKKIKLPGFRPGHAPKALIEGMIPREDLYEDAANLIIQKSFKKALEQEEIETDRSVLPTVELSKIDKDEQVTEYVAKVPLPPKVTLGEYKGLPLDKPEIDVTDEEVDLQVEDFRKRRQTRESVTDRGVMTGDVAVLNLKVEGEEGDGRNFMTIAGQTFPQLDEAIQGMHIEEMKSLELTFPENFQEKDWATQTHKTQITVNSLSSVKLPELDDSFAQSLQTENIQDLRNRIREALASAKVQMVSEMVTDQLLERLHERSEVFVSDNMWEALANQRLRETAEEQNKAGKSLEDYAAENGMSIEALQKAWQEKAKMHIERALLIREVFSTENMELTNTELNVELVAMAKEYEVPPEQLVKMLQESNALDELHFRAISRKVSRFLESTAEVKSVAAIETVASAEAPAAGEATTEEPA